MVEKVVKYGLLILFGFVAQMIDGGLGMGYGVSLTTLLLSLGFTSALASASTHISEIFTTFASGVSHFKFGNFDKKIFTYLTISGVVGGVVGAYTAVKLQQFSGIKLIVSGILLFFGILIVVKLMKKKNRMRYVIPRIRGLIPLGFVGAF